MKNTELSYQSKVFPGGRFMTASQHNRGLTRKHTSVHPVESTDNSDLKPEKILLSDLTQWREQLARSIARNNLGMRSEQIATAVNRIILSFMFLRIAEDRGLIEEGTLMGTQDSYDIDQTLLKILQYSRILYADDPPVSHENSDYLADLVLEDGILITILSALTSADRRYDLASMPAEILAQVFLRYLTRTVRRSAAHQVAIIDTHDTTRSGGTTSPPLHAIEYLVKSTLAAARKNRSARENLPLRVLDPACGAGVFLLSVYRHILENNGNRALTFEERREILTGSIHGLDINRHAVAVTRMLLFFRLAENRPAGQTPKDFFTLSEEVFQDLRHTIRCGNALIGPEIIHDESWMFCPARDRHTLAMFNWPEGFSEIFATGGFDAVLCNPPEGLLEDREWIQQYFQRHYQVYHPLADQSAYVIEKGVSLLRTGGTLTFFLNNRWLRGSSGSPLRMLLGTKQIEEIVDFSVTEKCRPGSAPCILRISNRPPTHPFCATMADISFSGDLDECIRAHRFPVDQAKLDNGGWALSDTRTRDLLEKVYRNGAPLEDFVMGQVHVGIETRCSELFVIDAQARKNLIKKDPRCKKLLRRLVSGSDIDRYHVDPLGRSIVFIPPGWTNTHPAAVPHPWQWFKKRHPSLARHLKRTAAHAGILSNPGYLWWESACDNDFWREKNPKILFRHQFKRPVFAIDEGRAIADSTAYAISSSSLYLLGVLNSRLILFVFEKSGQLRSADPQVFSWQDLKNLPIYTIDFDNPDDKARHDRMVTLVTEMLELHKHLSHTMTDQEKRLITQEIESADRQIDSLVYGLYGLTEDEITVVEESVSK